MIRTALPSRLLFVAALLSANVCLAQQLPKPGPEHTLLQKMEGTWDATVSVLGTKSKGELICKMECGGLWRERDLKSSLGTLNFHTKGLDGYDPVKKKYVSVVFDSASTVPMTMEGTYDEETKVFTLTGEGRNFDGSSEQIKTLTKYVDDDHVTFEMHRIFPGGKERKMITIEYTRRADQK
jgi:hypothetical protein